MRAAHLVIAIAVALAAAAACSPADGGPQPTSCPSDLPASCPMPTPSYKDDVAPIVARRCSPCHFPGGIEAATHDFSTYAGIAAQRSSVLDQVYSCRMPQAGAPPLGAAERATLLGWLVCKAPDN